MNASQERADRKERKGTQRTQRKRETSLLEFLGALCAPWRSWRQLSFVIIFLVIPFAAQAGEAAPADPILEARVMRIAAELRCLVCQNQSIADSHADLAVDLRQRVREMLQQGRSEAQILAFMTERYGDFVRYRPPLNAGTAMLWFGPALLCVGGLAGLAVMLVRRNRMSAELFEPDDADVAPPLR